MTDGRILLCYRAYPSEAAPLHTLVCKVKQPDRAPSGSPFLLTHFPYPVQSVSIRGVSTKLKVNSGRTNPPGQPSRRKPPPNKRDRPPRWFPGKSCADTTFESKTKGVAPPAYSARTNLQIDQDLHPGPRTFALDVLPALLSTYLPAQARQLISASNWLLCSSRVLRSINGDRRYWNVLTLHGSYPCHL
ncbi:hypothetical protein C9422_23695 [Pseudomonas sp. B1(2018)]|jgi:hypothetical protein|nr:hypothetical protein C9422_23695 [Pseudomonas sp. B1(2018)]